MRDPRVGIEKSIDEAIRNGEFDDLEGKGKPLVLDTSPDAVVKNLLKNANVVPEWIGLANQIDRDTQETEALLATYEAESTRALNALVEGQNAPEGVAAPESVPPPTRTGVFARLLSGWQKRPATDSPSVDEAAAAFNHRWDRTLALYAERLHLLNRQIRRFNLIVPLSNRHRHLIPVDERLDAFVQRYPRLLVGPGGAAKQVHGTVPEALLTPPPNPEDAGFKRDLAQAAALHEKRNFGRQPPPIG